MSSSNLLIGFETFAYGIPKVTFLLHLLKHPEASKLGGLWYRVWFFGGNISFERWC